MFLSTTGANWLARYRPLFFSLLGLLLVTHLSVGQGVPFNQVPDSTELRVLRQFYAGTGGTKTGYPGSPTGGWNSNTGWATLASATTLPANGTCPGLTVTNGDVTAIALQRNNLTDSIPPSLSQLKQLESLSLTLNSLKGFLPATLGQLSRLKEMDLAFNQFRGSLPSSLGQLSQLQSLILTSNQFSGSLPAELGQLSQLQELRLNNNRFNGSVPPQLGQLARLQVWNANDNRFTGSLPAALGQLSQLRTLNLYNNLIEGPLPAELGQLTNLQSLSLYSNRITGALPAAWGQLTNLQTLDIAYNQLSGPLPAELGQLQKLVSLVLNNNQLSGAIPAELANCSALRGIGLSYNRISGALPAGLAQLPLTYLVVNNNRLTGRIPASYVQFQQLTQLNLSTNQFSGRIPDSLSAVQLYLHNNHFSGALPAGYAQNTRLRELTLSSNDLSSLPDFRQHPARASLAVSATNNWLGFDTFELNQLAAHGATPFGWNFGTTIQRAPRADTLFKPVGTFTTLTRPAVGALTLYKWEYLVGELWTPLTQGPPTSDPPSAALGAVTKAHEGLYRVQMTHPEFGGAIIYSRPLYLSILPYTLPARNEPVASTNCAPLDLDHLAPPSLGSTNDTVNFVRTWSAREAFTDPAQLTTAPMGGVLVQTQYLDGLGRELQTVQHQASPQLRDQVQLHVYDELGREPRAYLPYTVGATPLATGNGYHANALRDQFDFYAGLSDVTTQALTAPLPKTRVAFAETGFEASPLNRVLAQAAPGETWQMNKGHATWRIERTNTAQDTVPRWRPGYGAQREQLIYEASGYAPGELWVVETSDEQGNSSQQFTTKEEQVVLRRAVSKTTELMPENNGTAMRAQPVQQHWNATAYVYDDFGRLRATIPPLAFDYLRQQNWNIDAGQVNKLLFRTHYDEQGRAIEVRTPDVDGYTTTVYDALDRPILQQDVAQRARGEWLATKYDAQGRVILTALTYFPASLSRDSLQAQATRAGRAPAQGSMPAGRLYELPSAAGPVRYYTDQAFPKLSTIPAGGRAAGLLSVSYYDGYDFDQNGSADVAYDPGSDAELGSGYTPAVDLRVTGVATRSMVRVLGVPGTAPGAWLTSTTFFDEKGRAIQVQSSNARGGTDVVSTRYNFSGQPLVSYATHQVPVVAPATVAVTHTLRQTSTYDHTGRLRVQTQAIDGQPAQILASQVYNELGQVQVKELGGGLQTVDYRYNIRGWLTQLNDAQLGSDSTDLFGLELSYECGFQQKQFNGNIAGQRWQARRGQRRERAYGYMYDGVNRLLQGDYIARAGGNTSWAQPTGGAWTLERDNYRFWTANYDANGNLLELRRRGLVQAGNRLAPAQYAETDHLRYSYSPLTQGNRLQQVTDQAPAASIFGTRQPERPDYKPGTTNTYVYDAAGSLSRDNNKGIGAIVYNHLHLPTKLHWNTNDSIRFLYTASGQKVAKLVYDRTKPGKVVRTDYLGPWQYERDTLQWLSHSEGRTLLTTDKLSQQLRYTNEYTIEDHLGNLRLAFRRGERSTVIATMEDGRAPDEAKLFDPTSLEQTRYTPLVAPGAYAGSRVARLNASQGTALGPMRLFAVQRGDTIAVQAPVSYPQGVQGNGFQFSLAGFVATLLSQPPSSGSGDGRTRLMGLNYLSLGLAAVPAIVAKANGVPVGYVRLLVYNQDSVLVTSQTRQLSALAHGSWAEQLNLNLVMPCDGYAQVYVGNESNADVWFDELKIVHGQSLQVQENEYDPFGLDLVGLSGAGPALRSLNQYQFNGKEKQTDFGLNWNHQDWRFFDPALGRWHVVDPLSDAGQEMWSTYQFGFDNAVRYADADGKAPGSGEAAMAALQQSIGDNRDAIMSNISSIQSAISNTYESAKGWMSEPISPGTAKGLSYSAGFPVETKGEAVLAAGIIVLSAFADHRESITYIGPHATGSYKALQSQKLSDGHHTMQHAAVKSIPGYSKRDAPAIHLTGPAHDPKTPHGATRPVQRNTVAGGTYGAERRVAYRALRAGGVTPKDAKQVVRQADKYFMGKLGATLNTKTDYPKDRKK